MHNAPVSIEGSLYKDERGLLSSFNEFNLYNIKRMYIISPASTEIIRAWQAHQYEEKWFLCLDGSFEIKLVAVDNFEKAAIDLPVYNFFLEAGIPRILHIPAGYANGFKANSENSRLIVYSNFTVTESNEDDHRYPLNTWSLWEK